VSKSSAIGFYGSYANNDRSLAGGQYSGMLDLGSLIRIMRMDHIYAILIGAAALAFFIWLLIPTSPPKEQTDGELIDPSDSRQIGLLIGLAGGGIADAAVARFALERFEQIHGRKATTRDVGIAVGLMTGGDNAAWRSAV
jgi:hypothetical protein